MMNLALSTLLRLGLTVVMLVAMPLQLSACDEQRSEQEQLLRQRLNRELEAFQAQINEIELSDDWSNTPYVTAIAGGDDERICDALDQLVHLTTSRKSAPAILMAMASSRTLGPSEALDATLDERTETNLIIYRWNQYVEKYSELRDVSFVMLDPSKGS